MSNDKLENEDEILRFLLGEMPEAERTAFEERFLTDEHLFERTLVVEDELIEAYIRETMPASDRAKFEAFCLTAPKRQARVAFTREMLGTLPERKQREVSPPDAAPSFSGLIAGFFRRPSIAFLTLFALMTVAAIGWFLIRSPGSPGNDIARQDTPIPIETSPTATPAPVSGIPPIENAVNKNTNTPALNPGRNDNKLPEETRPSRIVTLALAAGVVRSGGATRTLHLTKDTAGALLILDLGNGDYTRYRADLVDQDGNIVYRGGTLKPRKSKLGFSVPARDLQNGDYLVKVSGVTPNGQTESAADYQFRVIRK